MTLYKDNQFFLLNTNECDSLQQTQKKFATH